MASQEEIYQGFWTNWVDGRVNGATLTLSSDRGAYLVAIIALFVHVAGASFWRIASFAIFSYRARPDLNHDVILQQQTIFRNGASAISSLRGFFKIAIRSKDWKKSLLVILWAGINVAGFLAAGVLSSRVTSTRSEVLLEPTICGQWKHGVQSPRNISRSLINEAVRAASVANVRSVGQQYANICYNPENSPEGCNTFGRRNAQWKMEWTRSGCLFSDNLCLENTTLSIDSGLIASDLDLGINSPPADRVNLRTSLQCSPLKQDGYAKTYSGKDVLKLFTNNNVSGSSGETAQSYFNEAVDNHKFDAFFYGPSSELSHFDGNRSAATYIFNHGTFANSAGLEETTKVFLA